MSIEFRETTSAAQCNEEFHFVCSLPAMCHQDACKQKCAPNKGSIYCRESSPELEPPKCIPKCPPVNCSESVQKNIYAVGKLTLYFL
jgi:hypothetical protein